MFITETPLELVWLGFCFGVNRVYTLYFKFDWVLGKGGWLKDTFWFFQ